VTVNATTVCVLRGSEHETLVMAPKSYLPNFFAKWPLVIVAFGMALTLVWMAALVWFFITASGYAMASLNLIS
jgi:hypothetical protein